MSGIVCIPHCNGDTCDINFQLLVQNLIWDPKSLSVRHLIARQSPARAYASKASARTARPQSRTISPLACLEVTIW